MLWARLIGGHQRYLSYRGVTSNTSDATTYTFTGVDIGPPSPGRVIVVCTYASAGAARTINSITIGGNAMTSVVGVNGINNPSQMSRLQVDTGSTADIVVTVSGTSGRCSVVVYSLIGFPSLTVHNTASTSGTAATLSVLLNTPANGATIGFSSVFNGTGARDVSSFAGFSVADTSVVVESNQRVFSASTYPTASATAVTHSVTYSGTNGGGGALLAASFV